MFFLDSLWGGLDPSIDNDDIVTRIWSRNLSTLSIVTAEEIAKSSVDSDRSIHLDGGIRSSDSTLRELLDRERNRKGHPAQGTESSEGGTSGGSANQSNRIQSGLLGYEVTEEELATLAKEVEAESKQDCIMYILDMLTVIFASEKSPALLTKLISLWGNIVESLLREGKWTVLEKVLGLLQETDTLRPDISEEHKQQLTSLFDGLGRVERVKSIETYLNRSSDANTKGLSTILLLMKSDAVPALCSLLANLAAPVHQAIVSETLMVLAKDQHDPLLKGLSDRRPIYVRNLLSILIKWNNPKFIEAVEKLVRYPDAQVRKEVVRAISLFRPSGNGMKLVSFLEDADDSVRIVALKLLISGRYTAAFSLWPPILSAEDFMDRPMSERRAVFRAVQATCGDEAMPYWEKLLTDWAWTNRKKKEELAILAAETLGKLATPAAIGTLELGVKNGSAAVRQTYIIALSQIQKQQHGKPSISASR